MLPRGRGTAPTLRWAGRPGRDPPRRGSPRRQGPRGPGAGPLSSGAFVDRHRRPRYVAIRRSRRAHRHQPGPPGRSASATSRHCGRYRRSPRCGQQQHGRINERSRAELTHRTTARRRSATARRASHPTLRTSFGCAVHSGRPGSSSSRRCRVDGVGPPARATCRRAPHPRRRPRRAPATAGGRGSRRRAGRGAASSSSQRRRCSSAAAIRSLVGAPPSCSSSAASSRTRRSTARTGSSRSASSTVERTRRPSASTPAAHGPQPGPTAVSSPHSASPSETTRLRRAEQRHPLLDAPRRDGRPRRGCTRVWWPG